MFCKKCGKPVSDTARFCAHCGEPLSLSCTEDAKLDGVEPVPSEVPTRADRTDTAQINDETKTANDPIGGSESEPTTESTTESEREGETRSEEDSSDLSVCPEPKAEPSAETSFQSESAPAPEPSAPSGAAQTETKTETTVRSEEAKAETRSTNDIPKDTPRSCAEKAPAEAPAKEKTPPRVPIGLRILSALLCLLLFSFALSASFIGVFRPLLNSDTLIRAVENVKLSEISIGGESLAKAIYDACDDQKLEQYHLTEQKIRRLLNDADIAPFLENTVKPYLSYILGETNEVPALDADDIVNAVRENEQAIFDATGYRMTEADYRVMRGQLNEALGSIAPDEILRNDLPFLVRFGISYLGFAYGVMVVLSVVLLLFVFLSNRMHLHESALHLTVTFFACGLIFLLLFGGLWGFFATNAQGGLLLPVFVPCGIRAGGYIALGVLSLILYKVSGKRKDAKKSAN